MTILPQVSPQDNIHKKAKAAPGSWAYHQQSQRQFIKDTAYLRCVQHQKRIDHKCQACFDQRLIDTFYRENHPDSLACVASGGHFWSPPIPIGLRGSPVWGYYRICRCGAKRHEEEAQ